MQIGCILVAAVTLPVIGIATIVTVLRKAILAAVKALIVQW